jgi:hypothetical protein
MTATIPGRVNLDSSTLAAATYDNIRAELELDFRDGTRYTYSEVAPEIFDGLLRAGSKGWYFNRYIRSHFPYVKIRGEN